MNEVEQLQLSQSEVVGQSQQEQQPMASAPVRDMTALQVAKKLESLGRATNKYTVLSWTKTYGPGGTKSLKFDEKTVAGGLAKQFSWDEVLAYISENGLQMPKDEVTIQAEQALSQAAAKQPTGNTPSAGASQTQPANASYVTNGEVHLDKFLADLDFKMRTLIECKPATIAENQKFAAAVKALSAEVRALMDASHADKLRRSTVLQRADVIKMLAELAQSFRSQGEALVADLPSKIMLMLSRKGVQPEAIEQAANLKNGELVGELRLTVQTTVHDMLARLAEQFRGVDVAETKGD